MSERRRLSVFLLTIGWFLTTTASPAGATEEVEDREVEPARVRTESRIRYLEPRPGIVYVLPDDPPTEEGERELAKLTSAERELFERRRIDFLSRLTTAIGWSRLGLGTGVYLKNRLVRLIPRRRETTPLKSVAQHGREAVQAILQAANRQLFEHASVVARANEFGFTVSLYGRLGLAWGKTGFHETAGLGLAVGYNSRSRDLGFELFLQTESLERAIPASVEGVAHVRAGLSAQVREPGTEGRGTRLRVLAPPGPIKLIDNAHTFEGALSWSLGLGLPVQLGLETRALRIPLFRVSVSPLRPGFLRVGGLLLDSVREALFPLEYFVRDTLRRAADAARWAAGQCRSAWSRIAGL